MPHEQRVVDERAALEENVAKLEAFLKSATCHALPRVERDLLVEQFHHMCGYSSALAKRIKIFKETSV